MVLEPASNRLLKVIGLWRLVVSEPETKVLEAARAHAPIVVAPLTDREEVARLISKYNLLAVPVVTESGQVLGIVTVDAVIDAIIAEGTEDVQKFGGSQALDEAYLNIGFATMIRKRAGWLCALFLSEMLTASVAGCPDSWPGAHRHRHLRFAHRLNVAVCLAAAGL